MVSSKPNILWLQVRIPSSPSSFYSICINEIVTRYLPTWNTQLIYTRYSTYLHELLNLSIRGTLPTCMKYFTYLHEVHPTFLHEVLQLPTQDTYLPTWSTPLTYTRYPTYVHEVLHLHTRDTYLHEVLHLPTRGTLPTWIVDASKNDLYLKSCMEGSVTRLGDFSKN